MDRQRRSWPWGNVASGLIFHLAVITFIVLKLTGVISWAWLWVLSPLWIEGLLVVFGATFGLIVGLRWYARNLRGDGSGQDRG